MNLEPWQREFDVALGAVREGAALARDIRQRIGERALLKADRSPVTVADFSVQALVVHRLGQAFPDDPLVAEEDSASLQLPDARPTLQSRPADESQICEATASTLEPDACWSEMRA